MSGLNYDIGIENGKVVSFIGGKNFDGTVVIPDGVTEIGRRAFETPFSNVKKVIIPSTVIKIGERGFACCELLEEIIIPEGLTVIDDEAFAFCHSLKKVIISSTVTTIGAGVFNDCGAIEEIVVAENNPVYHSSGNCLIETKKKLLLRGSKNCVIPDDGSVTVIGEKTFSNDCAHPRNNVHSEGINEIVIPDCIVKICKEAFSYNYRLESVVIPDSVKIIEKEAFSNCCGLKNIKLGSGLQTIGDSAFYYNDNLNIDLVLPESITKIGRDAFSHCGIVSVKIGKNVNTIPKNAFTYCNNLKEVILPSGVTEIGDFAFNMCRNLESINLPDTLKKIGELAFGSCEKLKELTFPDGLETIGEAAFEYCKSLEQIEIPESVKYIGAYSFCCCEKLGSVKLPASVEFMGKNVFDNCPVTVEQPKKTGAVGFEIKDNVLVKYNGKNKDVVIPEGVIKIAAKAISNKKIVESVTLPASLTAIANKGIDRCYNLKSITVSSGNTVFKSVGNCLIDIKKKTLLYGFKGSEIPNDGSVTAIAAGAFEGTEIENIVIPEGVKTIGNGAFRNCKNLKCISMPKSVKSIGPEGFKNCEALISITVPQSVTSIAADAFAECTALTEINFNADCCGDLLPSSGVFDNAGKNAGGITVNVGANVQKIPEFLFATHFDDSAPKITQVNFAENSVCKSIGKHAFEVCTKIKSIKLPDSITIIDSWAFYKCTGLKNINIPKCATKLITAFEGCKNLKEIIIPASVTKIVRAFEGCGGLEKIVVEEGNPVYHSTGNCLIDTENKILVRGCCNSVIPSDGSVIRLDNYSFNDCTTLENIVIPDGVLEIFNNAFENCKNLKSVTIAKTVTYVCNPYFEKCSSLEQITASKELLEKYNYFEFKGKIFGQKGRRVNFSFL